MDRTPAPPCVGAAFDAVAGPRCSARRFRQLDGRTQAIANLKTWQILHTDYRWPLATFTTTISTVITLHFYEIN